MALAKHWFASNAWTSCAMCKLPTTKRDVLLRTDHFLSRPTTKTGKDISPDYLALAFVCGGL